MTDRATEEYAPQLSGEARGWLTDAGVLLRGVAEAMSERNVIAWINEAYAGGWEQFTADTASLMTVDRAVTGDDLLTAVATIAPDDRERALSARGPAILREAADLCGIDSAGMTKRQAIKAILANF